MVASGIALNLMLSTLGKIFSRRHFEIVFLIFPREQELIFHANCLQYVSDVNPVFWVNKKIPSICRLLN